MTQTNAARRWGGALTAAVTLAALTACGGGDSGGGGAGGDDAAATTFAEDSTAEEIRDAAITAMEEAESLRMDGSITAETGEVELDLSADRDGNCSGTIGITGGSPAEVLGTGGKAYVKGDADFWSGLTGNDAQGQQIADQIGDKWALLPGEGFNSLCDLDELLSNLDEDAQDQLEKGEVTDVDGTEAITVTSEKDGETTTTYVATGEPHYVLRLEKEGGSEPGGFTVSEFDEPVEAEAPAEDDVLDLSQLTG